MKTCILSPFLALVLLAVSSSAFVILKSTNRVTTCASRKIEDTKLTLAASTLDTNESKSKNSDNSKNKEDTSSTSFDMREKEMEEVRMELIAKYLSAGKSQEYAEQEVDKFLSDPDRSEKYLDMRRYAKAQADELMGFESIFVIGGAFLLGLTGNVMLKYLSAYKEVYPNGDGPIPFL
eukprot:CAMPEP_0176495604 /NCGR_PEP_ID=MMETSP0200_2-20121128/10747_1 /TAXON_ID=947934 /ORGANISM="Chaetoceros sp., Strain GSL56" /LENGTH=177 /DNA_ID=CAMNT_0017893497 /DNA_START=560 /DNA_END=1093 /DNA_ORIENTATION=+